MDQSRILHLRSMPYEEYLQTSEWAAKRDQALERDGYRCRVCNGGENLQVHHRTYARRGNEELNDLTTLCQRCHEHFHKIIFQADMIGRTYEKPREAQVEGNPKKQWEMLILGMLLQHPEHTLYATGILDETDFHEEGIRSLYQWLCGEVDQAYTDIPPALSALASQCTHIYTQNHAFSKDKSRQIKTILEAATRLRRVRLLESNTSLRELLHDAAKSGDNDLARQYHSQLLDVNRQLRTIDSAIRLQG